MSEATQNKPPKSSKSSAGPVAKTVARLHAVQAIYGQLHNKDTAALVLNHYMDRVAGMVIEGEEDPLVMPDKPLLSKIIQGVEDRGPDLHGMIRAAAEQKGHAKEFEPLLNAILLCGAYELLAHGDIDSPIILNDYLDITHSFYSQKEPSLVNGILDTIKSNLR